MQSPLGVSKVFDLNTVTGGLRPGVISFKTVTLEGDKHVCVRDVQADGQTSLVIVDLERRESARNNIRDAEAAIMNPSARILALRSKRNLQIFDLDASRRLKAVLFSDDVVYWHWIDDRTIGIVSPTTVYHWSLDVAAADAPPERVFDRGADYDGSVQILSYRADEQKKWLVLAGVTRDASGAMVGKALLYSVENNSSRVLDGHACCFVTTPLPNEPRSCNVMCMAWNSTQRGGGQVMIMELPTGNKLDVSLPRRVYDVRMQPGDFPVAMHASARYTLLTIVTSRGMALLMDLFSGTVLAEQAVTPAIVFCGADARARGGVVCVNNQGEVLRVAPDDGTLIAYVKGTMQNPQLALRIASSAGLGGVDELFRAQLDAALRTGNVDEAVRTCMRAPANALRTREVLEYFKRMPVAPGAPPALSVYFKAALAESAPLNAWESVELARAAVLKGSSEYVKQQYDAGRLTASEELGDVVATRGMGIGGGGAAATASAADGDLAIKIYQAAGSHAKVVNVFLQRHEPQNAVQYCKLAKFAPDWRVVLRNFVRAAPQDAVALALMLYRDMAGADGPGITADEVVDLFVTNQNIQQATEFLLEVLHGASDESTSELQTKLLEINLKFSPPSVAEKIFARNLCRFYDGMKLAPLCERAGLYQRAIECYVAAQRQDADLNNLDNIRRCLKQASTFSPEWLVSFFGMLNKEDSLKCLDDLCHNHRQNFKVLVQVATKYSDALGARSLIDLFVEHGLYDVLYYYLGAIVPYTRDAEVHFRYIEAAAEVGQMQELERMTRESPCYDAERTKNYLRNKKLTDLWPFINVCDTHNMLDEMVRYLVDTGNEVYIEQYVTRRNPSKTPQVVGALIDCNVSEEFVKSLLGAVGTMCPIAELVHEVDARGRLHLIKEWLEERRGEKKTDAALYNALAKIYIDLGQSPERFLTENTYYDSKDVGAYAESRDPNLAYLAYARGHCSDELLELCIRNGMYKALARYLVKEQSLDLWARVLAADTDSRRQLIEAVQQSALPETQVSEEVSTTVRAFMNANLTEQLTSLLDQIVVQGRFRKNRYLENLLIMSAVRARKDKVMDYVVTLDDYDAKDIASIATGAGMFDVAFAVYDKHAMPREAVTVLLRDMKDFSRGRSYAQKLDAPEVWSVLGEYLVKAGDVHEGIECLIKAKNADLVAEVTAAAEQANQYGDLIKYLTMARTYSKTRDSAIDTALVLTYAKTGRLGELEAFLREAHNVNLGVIADKCFSDGLYDSARVLYAVSNNYARLALTEVKLGNLAAAVDVANKAKSIDTYKAVHLACLDAGEMKLAAVCAVPVLLKAEEVSAMSNRYESRGLWEELLLVLRTTAGNAGAHMAIFTEMAILLAKYKPDKLLEHVNMYPRKINTHKMIAVCEQYHHWLVLRVLHINNEDWLAAANVMMTHFADAWDHEVFKEVAGHLGAGDVIYSAIGFYLRTYPAQLSDYLSSIYKRADPERVMAEVKQHAPIAIVRAYLEAAQERNSKKVNEALNQLYIDENNIAALRHSVETFDHFDSQELAAKLEQMTQLDFRKVALLLHRKNKRYAHAIAVAKQNALYTDAIETAAESGDAALVEGLLDFFVKDRPECFAACLYACYDLLRPEVVLQKAWMSGRMDLAMPYMIQTLQDYSSRVARMEQSMTEAQNAAKDAARRAGPVHGPGVATPLMIEQGGPVVGGAGNVMMMNTMGGVNGVAMPGAVPYMASASAMPPPPPPPGAYSGANVSYGTGRPY